jgi:hypothetical protein
MDDQTGAFRVLYHHSTGGLPTTNSQFHGQLSIANEHLFISNEQLSLAHGQVSIAD